MLVPHLTYFWITALALVICSFLFNPHQFVLIDFLLDYREYLHWLSRGNSKTHGNSWIAYCRLSRTMITGFKKKRLGDPSEKFTGDMPGARISVIIFSEIIMPFLQAFVCVVAYLFVKSVDSHMPNTSNHGPSGLLRIAAISLAPIFLNAGALIAFFIISLVFGPVLSHCFVKFGAVVAAVVHTWAVINLIASVEFLWYLEDWNTSRTVLDVIAAASIQKVVFKLLTTLLLTREFKHDGTNRAWWSGTWYSKGLG
ncbi:hypothetical protein BZG36_04884 [Bifiguratus adelaidae]|uniref:Glycosyl transferase 48 domain-containing protein n=1 Tax=Bifiguratus adelaidae TaxID=1938954 RepID=A0A261XVJ0_9FUNG|nr:hypothetical protein BZG36_04884 [Bifiguratus adelaidae]